LLFQSAALSRRQSELAHGTPRLTESTLSKEECEVSTGNPLRLTGMRDPGTPEELEHRRLLAVQRALEGYPTAEVAAFLGVNPRSVRRWVATSRQTGDGGRSPDPPPDDRPS
jgi:hypothetical protein